MGDDGAVPAGSPDKADEAEAVAERADGGIAEDSADETEKSVLDDHERTEAEAPSVSADSDVAASARPRASARSLALIGGLVVVLALGTLAGWLGYHAFQSQRATDRRAIFLQVGRESAMNLTTIDFEHAEDDVKRIADSATGQFYDDFQHRAQSFTEVVKQIKSKSVGTVTEAGLQIPDGESASTVPDSAEVLVAVTVNTSIVDQPQQAPRAFRMRIQVQQDGDGQPKVSKVDFVL